MIATSEDIVSLFNAAFRETFNTVLERGGDTPYYIPASPASPARIIFAHGFASSALHEISHWCIAGDERRTLADYGYWYKPDGRDADGQAAFERVETKPQAIEKILSVLCRVPFHVSLDNLSGPRLDSTPFERRVDRQVQAYLFDEKGSRRMNLPSRAALFARLCMDRFQTEGCLWASLHPEMPAEKKLNADSHFVEV